MKLINIMFIVLYIVFISYYYMPRCLCLTKSEKQCSNLGSTKKNMDPQYCWIHQKCSKLFIEDLKPKEVSLKPKEVSLKPKEVSLKPKEVSLKPKEVSNLENLEIKTSTINVFDHYKNNEYKLFGDCSKIERLLDPKKKIGAGQYGTVFKYCFDEDCQIGYAIKKLIVDDIDDELNSDSQLYASLRIGYLLNLFVISNMTPHIILTLGDFQCKIKDIASHIIISSLEDGDLSKIFKNLSVEECRNVLFQIIFTLATIQSVFPEFRHNDLKYTNIFYRKTVISPDSYLIYKIKDKIFKLPDIGITVFIADFDLSCIPETINNKSVPFCTDFNEYNLSDAYNPYYDLAFLLYVMYNQSSDDEIVNLIGSILKGPPNSWNPETSRPINNSCWKTPLEILDTEIFDVYKNSDSDSDLDKVCKGALNVYNANQKLPEFDNSIMIDRFKTCIHKKFVLPHESNNITDFIFTKNCKISEDILPNSVKYTKDTSTSYFSYMKFVYTYNNYLKSLPITNEIMIELTVYIYEYMIKNYKFYNVSVDQLVEAILLKLSIYFIDPPYLDTDKSNIYAKQIYKHIPMSYEFISNFFQSKLHSVA
jgi:mRNA-degrading endonuclease YafQ of YafQ-DinJ toxin-antitoxin module